MPDVRENVVDDHYLQGWRHYTIRGYYRDVAELEMTISFFDSSTKPVYLTLSVLECYSARLKIIGRPATQTDRSVVLVRESPEVLMLRSLRRWRTPSITIC